MSDVLVAAWPGSGIEDGRLTRAGLEQLGAARAATGETGLITLVALGPGSSAVAATLSGVGVQEVVAIDADLDDVGTDGYLEVLDRLTADRRPDVVVLFNDARGRELGPRLAARRGGTAINDVVAVAAGERRVWSRPCFGGKAVAELVARRQPEVVTIRPRAFAPIAPDGGAGPTATFAEGPSGPCSVKCEQVRAADRSGARLEDAKVIVAGGRGLGDQESFDRLGELATLLGGLVGASLAAVDEGWATADQQVGLTGKVVSPELYIAVGISGASQHIAGLAAVKTIVAINSDASAPIFQVANLGAVLDARQAIPALIAELRRRAG